MNQPALTWTHLEACRCLFADRASALTTARPSCRPRDTSSRVSTLLASALCFLSFCMCVLGADTPQSQINSLNQIIQNTVVRGRALLIPWVGVQSLAGEVERCLSDAHCSSSSMKRSLALFFSALQAVQPAEDFAPPPPCQTYEPLSRETRETHARSHTETVGQVCRTLNAAFPESMSDC